MYVIDCTSLHFLGNDFSYSYAVSHKISTVIARRAVSLRQLTFLLVVWQLYELNDLWSDQ